MARRGKLSFVIGFIVLFSVYHFPEWFTAFWIMAVFKIGFLVVAFILARMQDWKGLGGYGLALKAGWGADLLKGLLAGILVFSLAVLLSVWLGYQEITSVTGFKNMLGQLPLLLLMTAIPSLAEDILTRGYLYGHLQKLKPVFWIVLSTMVYVLNHIWRLGDGAAVISYLSMLGAVLATAVWLRKSLWLAFGIHWGANIAFESTHSLLQVKDLVAHDGATWVLAGCWFLMLLLIALPGFLRNVKS